MTANVSPYFKKIHLKISKMLYNCIPQFQARILCLWLELRFSISYKYSKEKDFEEKKTLHINVILFFLLKMKIFLWLSWVSPPRAFIHVHIIPLIKSFYICNIYCLRLTSDFYLFVPNLLLFFVQHRNKTFYPTYV